MHFCVMDPNVIDGPPRINSDLIGIYNILVFVIAFPMNICFLAAIFKDKCMWRLTAYQIVFHMSVAHILLSISTLELGIIALLAKTCRLNKFIIAIGSLIAYFGPIGLCVFSTLQALNRLAAVAPIYLLDNTVLFTVLLWLIWVLLAFAGFVVIQEGTEFTFETVDFLYHFYNEMPAFAFFYCLTIVFLVFGVVLYSLAILSIVLRRGSTRRGDVALLVQGIIPFIYLALVRSLQTFTFKDASIYYIIFLSLAFRSLPLVHIGVYMGFNRTLRQSVLRLLKLRKWKNKISIAVTNVSRSVI